MTETQPTGSQLSVSDIELAEPDRLSTIIASAPGIMAQSLRAMMESVPVVQVVGMAAGCLSRCRWCATAGLTSS